MARAPWLTHKGFPALEARSWHFTGTPILLRSFAVPVQRMCMVVGIYLAASSLPWAIPGVRKLFLMAFQLVMTLLVCEGLYAASELADLVLASCSPEIRSNKTLLSLLTPPTRYWSLQWAWPPVRRRWASPSAASLPVPVSSA